jgi:hypothetical protein
MLELVRLSNVFIRVNKTQTGLTYDFKEPLYKGKRKNGTVGSGPIIPRDALVFETIRTDGIDATDSMFQFYHSLKISQQSLPKDLLHIVPSQLGRIG